jgi:hypothetical protein
LEFSETSLLENSGKLTTDDMENLIKILPTNEEIELVKNFQVENPNKELPKVEQFFFTVTSMKLN